MKTRKSICYCGHTKLFYCLGCAPTRISHHDDKGFCINDEKDMAKGKKE